MSAEAAEPDYDELVFRDAVADGAFNAATGELRPGFSISADDVVLDVGCGEGRDTVFCARRGAHVIYVDSDPDQIWAASERMAGAGARELTPIVSDANPLPLPDGVASKVIACEVIEHVDDPAQFLKELVRAGRPGAQYLLAVPDPIAEELQRGLAPAIHFEKPNHIRVIGRDEFARMVTDAGLVIEHRGAYGFYLTIWWMFFWICHVDLSAAHHPLLESWSKTWRALLDTPGNAEVRDALNGLMPKSQYIVARKPGGSAKISFGRVRAGLEVLRRFLWPTASAVGMETATLAVPPSPMNDISSLIVGRRDAAEGGWLRMEQRELCEGFPITPDDVVLDAGCGDGDYSTLCGQWGAHVVFADGDAGNLRAHDDGSVSKIISTGMIDHVDDPVRFLGELARVGKPGALYLLGASDAVQEGLQHRLAPPEFFAKPKAGDGMIRGVLGGHIRTIGRDEFERLVTDAGLVIESHHYVGFYWALWFALFWICKVDFTAPQHPLLANWAQTWKLALDLPEGRRVKAPLDNFMPRNQVIIARKP